MNVLGVTGLVLAVLGLAGCYLPWMLIFSGAGLALSLIGLIRTPRMVAVAGVVIGAIGLAMGLAVILAAPEQGEPTQGAPADDAWQMTE